MFRFENPFALYALALIPIFVLLFVVIQYRRKRQFARFGEPKLLKQLIPTQSPAMKHLKFSLLLLAFACFIFALANPQVGSSLEKGKRQGVDIMICCDISNSMLAEDIQPNRLEASKMAMNRFIDKLNGDRVGLVVFAGNAFVQLPITSDYAAAKMFINYITPSLISEQGTDLAAALDLAAVSMLPQDDPNAENAKMSQLTSKVMVVVSDGEDHFEEAIAMAREVNKLGIVIHTIGIGSVQGAPIPMGSGNANFKKDSDGNTVMTRLNEAILRDIAAAGQGTYVHANNANMGFDEILKRIDAMEKSELDEITFTRFESQFQYPLLCGLVLLFLEMLLFGVKSNFKSWILRRERHFFSKTSLIFVLIMLSINVLQAQTKDELHAIRNGNREFKKAEQLREEAMGLHEKGGEINAKNAQEKMKETASLYQKAETLYRKALSETPNYDKGNYNLGTALYRQEKYDEAAQTFEQVAKQESSDKSLRAKAFHNLGNALMKQEKFQESVDAYKNSLKLNPKDMDTKYNLEYAKKKLLRQQQQQQQNQQNQQNQDQNQQNQDKNQQNQDQNQQNQDKNQQNQDKNQQNQGKNQQNQDKNQQNQDKNQQNQDKNEQNQGKDEQQSAAERQKRQNEERQLDALQQNERQTQEKVKQQQMQRGVKSHHEKDW